MISLTAAVATAVFLPEAGGWGIASVAGGLWLMSSTARYFVRLLKASARRWPSASETGMTLAHFGVGVFLIGAGLTSAISSEKHLRMEIGDSFEMVGYRFEFEGTKGITGPNYVADEGQFTVYKGNKRVATLYPQKRRYSSGGQIMTEAAIDPGLTRDLYVSLGEALDDTGRTWAIRIYHKPFIRFIWMGALMMMAGGFLAAIDRRYRRRRRDEKQDSSTSGAQLAEQTA